MVGIASLLALSLQMRKDLPFLETEKGGMDVAHAPICTQRGAK